MFSRSTNLLTSILWIWSHTIVGNRVLFHTKRDNELIDLTNHHTYRRVARRSQSLWRSCHLGSLLFFVKRIQNLIMVYVDAGFYQHGNFLGYG